MKTHDFIEKKTKKPKAPKLPAISEYKLHCLIAQFLSLVIKKPSRWTTIEVSNHGSGKAAMINQMMDRKKGVTTAFPDILIIWRLPFQATYVPGDDRLDVTGGVRLIFLEVKVPGGKLTEKQEALHKELREEGHVVEIVRSIDETKAILTNLGVI